MSTVVLMGTVVLMSTAPMTNRKHSSNSEGTA
jgi:hypothetical protein